LLLKNEQKIEVEKGMQGKSGKSAGWPPGRDLPLGESVSVASPFHAPRGIRSVEWTPGRRCPGAAAADVRGLASDLQLTSSSPFLEAEKLFVFGS